MRSSGNMQRIAQRAGVASASSHALQLKGVESSAALFRNAQISKLGPVVMARRTTPISSLMRAGQLQRALHSSAHPRALFGLFGGGSKEEAAQQSDKKAQAEEEISEEEAARQDEAEATAVVNRAAGLVDPSNLWSPTVELPIESFLTAELQAPLGTVRLNPNIFMVPIRRDILHRVVVWQLAKRRQGTHKSKSRAEVSGGGRKPRPQKGTGRSRQGSIRSPLWRGGGHAHAKRPRNYDYPLLKKVRKLGLKMALSLKLAQGKLKIVRSTDVDEAKTRNLVRVMKTKNWGRSLVIDGKDINDTFRRASQNLHNVKVLSVGACNVFDILNHEYLVLSLDAIQSLEERLLEADEPAFYDFQAYSPEVAKEQTLA